MNKIKNIYNKINKYIPLIIIYIFTIAPLLVLVKKYGMSPNTKFIFMAITIVVDTILFLFLNSLKMRTELKYTIVLLLIGLLYMFAIPLGRVPDEKTHFLRAYEISKGYLISDKGENGGGGRDLPEEINSIFEYGHIIKYSDEVSTIDKKASDNNRFYYFPNTSLYAFVCYLPQSIGIFIGRVLNLPIVVTGYLGRLFNFLVFVLLFYYAIKLLPFKKNLLILFAFMPMVFQEAISLAPDALTNGIALLLISYILYIKYDSNKKIKREDLLRLSVITVVMSLCKIVYLPLCLLLFLLPENKFKNRKEKYKFIFTIAGITILINMVWLAISSSYLNEIKEGVNPSGQVLHILTHPISYINTLFYTIYLNSELLLFNTIGSSLCYFDVNLSFMYPFAYLCLIIYYLIVDNDKRIKTKEKLLPIFIILSTALLIFTSLYIQWTPMGLYFIDGAQGRYFIPLVLLLAVIFNSNKFALKKDNNKSIINIMIIIFNVYAIIELVFFHI